MYAEYMTLWSQDDTYLRTQAASICYSYWAGSRAGSWCASGVVLIGRKSSPLLIWIKYIGFNISEHKNARKSEKSGTVLDETSVTSAHYKMHTKAPSSIYCHRQNAQLDCCPIIANRRRERTQMYKHSHGPLSGGLTANSIARALNSKQTKHTQ